MRDYAELITRLKQSDDNCNAECFECSGECLSSGCNIFSEAADAIEELLSKVPHWISVEDEPPKENGRYLVRYKRDVDLGDEETVHEDEIRIMRFFVGDGWRYPIICNDHVRLVSEEVTHWMPLPKPPKEVE